MIKYTISGQISSLFATFLPYHLLHMKQGMKQGTVLWFSVAAHGLPPAGAGYPSGVRGGMDSRE